MDKTNPLGNLRLTCQEADVCDRVADVLARLPGPVYLATVNRQDWPSVRGNLELGGIHWLAVLHDTGAFVVMDASARLPREQQIPSWQAAHVIRSAMQRYPGRPLACERWADAIGQAAGVNLAELYRE